MTVQASNRPWRRRAAWAVVPNLSRGLGKVAWRLNITTPANPLPQPPYVVAANHHSFLDGFLVAAALRDEIRFLGLQDLFGNHRWVDFALDSFDVIPISRGMVPLGPIRTALHHLDAGGSVGLFPEGTRHWEFEPSRAKHGAAWLATRTGVPLVPVAVSGTERVLGVDNKLHTGRIGVVVGEPLYAMGDGRAAVEDLTGRWGGWVAANLT